MWFNMFAMVLFSLAVYAKMPTLDEGIKEEFSRITRYDLAHFDLSSLKSHNIISFDLFNKHYQVQLTVNPFIIMGQIDHMDGDINYGSNNLNISCHYQGTILNIDGPSSVALSMCPNRGIRGSIQLPNDRLEINPSRHYFQGESNNNNDEIHDEHLIYKISDFNSSGYPQLKLMQSQLFGNIQHDIQRIKSQSKRRRLGSSNTVQVYMFSAPSYTSARGGSSRAQSACADILNKVQSEYSRTSWYIGRINFQFSGFTAISSWSSSSYRGLRPRSITGGADADDLLIKMQNWVAGNLNARKYDAFHMIVAEDIATAQAPQWLGGLASGGTMCDGYPPNTVGVSRAWSPGDTSEVSKIAAHELGHNLGMDHDQNSGCGEGYIMGAHGGSKGWSSCSRNDLESHCKRKSNCDCLGGSSSGHDNLEGWGFEEEDNECLKTTEYSAKICVQMNGIKQEYKLSDALCVDKRGVYFHEKKYQLHWRAKNVSYGSWIITPFNMSYSALAECKGKWHLLDEECGNNKWKVRRLDDDQIVMIEDETLMVVDGACDVNGDSADDVSMVVVVVIIVVVFVSIVVLFVVYNIRRKSKVMMKMVVPDDEEEELEVDVEQNTTAMITDTN